MAETMAEKYSLNWQEFSDHLQLMFKDLYEKGIQSDLTLVCDDQTQLKAHKIVLRACSPVFQKIIDNNPSQHPLIYLRGIQSCETDSILQFMYLGEGKFYYERLGEFLKVAEDLEVKDINEGVEMLNNEEDVTEEIVLDDDEKVEENDEDDEPKPKSENKIRKRQPRNQISSDAKSKCPECGIEYFNRGTMMKHYRSKHEGIKYPCNQCDYQATQQSNLLTHIAAKHSDIILKCELCDFQTKWRQRYHEHKKSHATL